jgi:hypothetical protein
MRIYLCQLIILLGLINGFASASYRHMGDLKLNIAEVSRAGTVRVEMSNSSTSPVRIWRETNSWGAGRWRVVLIRKGRSESFFEDPDRDFTRNGPVSDEIEPGKVKTFKLDLNDSNWCGSGRCLPYGQRRSGDDEVRFQAGDEVLVIYDVPFTPESLRMDVWYGFAVAFTTVH